MPSRARGDSRGDGGGTCGELCSELLCRERPAWTHAPAIGAKAVPCLRGAGGRSTVGLPGGRGQGSVSQSRGGSLCIRPHVE